MKAFLFSGGMDSLIAWRLFGDAARDVRVYVRIGAPYEERELESIGRRGLLPGLRVVRASQYARPATDPNGRVRLRNLLFAVTAAAETGADAVVLGALAGETSPDKSRAFARAASRAMTLAEHRRIRLLMPMRGWTKRAAVARYLDRFGKYGKRDLTVCPSCYEADLPAYAAGCGRCTSCLRRWVAMSLNGIHETYLTPPWQRDLKAEGARGLLRYLWRTPPRDWPGVAVNNLELLRAVRREHAL